MRRETPLFTVTGRLLPFPVPSGHISSRFTVLHSPRFPSVTMNGVSKRRRSTRAERRGNEEGTERDEWSK